MLWAHRIHTDEITSVDNSSGITLFRFGSANAMPLPPEGHSHIIQPADKKNRRQKLLNMLDDASRLPLDIWLTPAMMAIWAGHCIKYPPLVHVFFGRGDIPELVSMLRTTHGVDCEEEDDNIFVKQINDHVRAKHSAACVANIQNKVDLERMFRFLRAFWRREKIEYEGCVLCLPEDSPEGHASDSTDYFSNASEWVACLSIDSSSSAYDKGDDMSRNVDLKDNDIGRLLQRRRGIHDLLDNLESALQEAFDFMAKTRKMAEEFVRTKLNYTGKDWQSALQDFRDKLTGRKKQILYCDVCQAQINLKTWPGQIQGLPAAASQLKFRDGWSCATCAEFLQKRGYDTNCCPTLFCSSNCKKAGQKLHAYVADFEFAKIKGKELKKRQYCEARVEERIAKFLAEQAREKRSAEIYELLVAAAGGTEELEKIINSDDKSKLKELKELAVLRWAERQMAAAGQSISSEEPPVQDSSVQEMEVAQHEAKPGTEESEQDQEKEPEILAQQSEKAGYDN